MSDQSWTFSYEGPLHETFPALHEAQSAWLAQIDSLQALDRKTHELVRMVCMVNIEQFPYRAQSNHPIRFQPQFIHHTEA